MERDFKGVWIPKAIWIDTKLSLQEKAFLVEIDSLDCHEDGCFASNDYFAEFFNLSKNRCSEIIQSLKEKGYISIRYKYKPGTKAIDKRIINIKNIKFFGIRYSEEGIRDMDRGTRNSDIGTRNVDLPYSENCEDNNTLINNTINNTINKNREDKSSTHSKRFKKPSIEEIHEYCLEKGYSMDSEAFYDYYESNGWIVGRHKMKDWKAAVRNWVRRSNEFKNGCNNRGSRSSTAAKLDNDYDMMKNWANDEHREEFTYPSYDPNDIEF